MVNENKIRCFLTLAETLSFTETAKRLYMTQQGVSKNISQTEEELGFPLFTRSRRSVALTKEGEKCYAIFSEFVKEYTEFLSCSRDDLDRQVNTLRVGYQNWLDLGGAPGKARAALREFMPDVELVGETYSPGVLIRRLIECNLDLILIHKRFCNLLSNFKQIELNQTPMLMLVAKSNPLNSSYANYKTFCNEPFLIDTFEFESSTDTLLRAQRELQEYGLNPSKIIIVPNRDSAYTAAELGQGILVSNAMAHIMDRGTLAAYPTDSMESLMCVWRNCKKSGAAEKYSKLLQKEYQNMNNKSK